MKPIGKTVELNQTLEIRTPDGFPALRVRVLEGQHGNIQVFVHTQPQARLHVDVRQPEIATILQADPTDEEIWPTQ